MGEPMQAGWTRFYTQMGRFEYQFQGRTPAVRGGQYLEAHDFQFLVMDEEGWLYRIPVQITAEAEKLTEGAEGGAQRVAETQLRAGLENYCPRENAPYPEMDAQFAVDEARARELAAKTS